MSKPLALQELWRNEGARAAVTLDASWSHTLAPAFIGPLMPPMLLWFARGRPKSAWEIVAEARQSVGVRRWDEGVGQFDLFADRLA